MLEAAPGGEQNPHGPDPEFALYPLPPASAGGRLCSVVLGLQRTEYLRKYDRVNLCSGPWSARIAKLAANRIRQEAGEKRRPYVVLLGAKVAQAFRIKFEPLTISRFEGDDVPVILLPHPSGRNGIWNDLSVPQRCRDLISQVEENR